MSLFGIENTNNSNDIRDKFDMSRFMEYSNNWYDSINSGIIYYVTKLSPAGYYTVAAPDGRPDLVSYALYNDTQYWWLLLIYNSILCPLDLKNGMQIKYFDLNQLYNIYSNLPVS